MAINFTVISSHDKSKSYHYVVYFKLIQRYVSFNISKPEEKYFLRKELFTLFKTCLINKYTLPWILCF